MKTMLTDSKTVAKMMNCKVNRKRRKITTMGKIATGTVMTETTTMSKMRVEATLMLLTTTMMMMTIMMMTIMIVEVMMTTTTMITVSWGQLHCWDLPYQRMQPMTLMSGRTKTGEIQVLKKMSQMKVTTMMTTMKRQMKTTKKMAMANRPQPKSKKSTTKSRYTLILPPSFCNHYPSSIYSLSRLFFSPEGR